MAYREEYASGAEPTQAEGRAPAGVPVGAPAPASPPATSSPPPEAAAAAKKSRPVGKLVVGLILAIALGFGGYEAFNWWTNGRFMVTTDDAYIQADITILSAKVSGYVASLAVANNQSVKAGDLIARIDDGDYRLALQSAKDKLATQQSTIDRIGRQVEAAGVSVTQALAQVDAARADASRSASDYGRQLQLAQSDYASKARLDQSKADRDRTEANVKSAEAAVNAARANVDVLSAQRVEAQRVESELETAVEKVTRDLSFTEIRAPVDGVVGNKAVEVGTFVQPGSRVAALVPLTSVHVDANFKETQFAALRPGQKVSIEVDAFPDHDVSGTIESVSPASGSVFSLLPPENATGNFTKIVQRVPVRVAVDPDVRNQELLRPGLSVVVSVDSRDRPHTKTAQK